MKILNRNSNYPSEGFLSALVWLLCSTVAAFMAINTLSISYTPSGFVPAGNDSFYHAARITDTVEDPSAFYEFDPKIHAPEGSWITWPWAYDYSMAIIARTAQWILGVDEPMTVLAYVPAIWTFINTGLILMVASALGLGLGLRLVAGLAFGLSTISQILHSVGMLDHHFIELSFILLAIWTTMRWALTPDDRFLAILVGSVLGIAPAFHVGLFILQVPVLLTLCRLWMDRRGLSYNASIAFAVALLASSIVMLLGSQPFLNGLWGYHLFSWFHLYIAGCTAAVALILAWSRFSATSAIGLIAAGLIASYPLVKEILGVSGFFGAKLPGLSDIIEVQPLHSMLLRNDGYWLETFFTFLALLTPLTFVGCLAAFWKSQNNMEIVFSAFGLLALPLFFAQIRFKYFGVAFLIIGPLWAAHRLIRLRPSWRIPVTAAILMLFVGSYIPSFINRADATYRLGLDPQFVWAKPLMPELSRLCMENPGIVLIPNSAGQYVRYYSECSVIGNNFLLTEQHAEKYSEVNRILKWTPQQLRERRPDIKYVIAMFRLFEEHHADGTATLAREDALLAANTSVPLMTTLLLSPAHELQGFNLVDEVPVRFSEDEVVAYSRLFKVIPLQDSEMQRSSVERD